LKANDKGKIKIRKVDDMTAKTVEIIIHLSPGVSPDKTIDALYAFTDCEIGISPNCCVIDADNKPQFMTVSDVLRQTVDHTLQLLQLELEIERGELSESLHFASLEKIFIEERIYKDPGFENAKDMDTALRHVLERIEGFVAASVGKLTLQREITRDDLLKLLEIRMGRILRFNKEKADEMIASCRSDIETIDRQIAHIVEYAIDWFTSLKNKYGTSYPRRTEIRSFDTIEAAQVVEANEKLYVNREEGFIGYGLKKDEYVCNCSDIDDVIVFFKDGKYKIVKCSEKMFVGKNILYLNVFKRNDSRTIYNVAYRDGRAGSNYIKRFAVTAVTRDKEYDLGQGSPGSKVLYFTANPNGEAETIKVILKPKPRQKLLVFDKYFGDVAVKGRASIGNILTKADVHKITLKTRGGSTLGGRQVWFDRAVLRVNYDGRGEYLGEFFADDLILVITGNGEYYTTGFDAGNHYQGTIQRIEKYNSGKVWSVALFDADQQNFPYLKRFTFEVSNNKPQSFLGENPASRMIWLTDTVYPRVEVTFGGHDAFREPLTVEVEDFIAVKSLKAKGKRISTFSVSEIREMEPDRLPEPEYEVPPPDMDAEPEEEEPGTSEMIDRITGQQRLF
jgi:topoisomerase-4 subunit A